MNKNFTQEENCPFYKPFENFLRNKDTCDNTLTSIIENNLPFKSIVIKNIDTIIENVNSVDLFTLREYLEDSDIAVNKINKAIDMNPKSEVCKYIQRSYVKNNRSDYLGYIYGDYGNKATDLSSIIEFIYLVVIDICKNEGVTPSALKFENIGEYSCVYSIGNKVMKLGSERATLTFSNNPYILVPLLRKKIRIPYGSVIIEVSEKIDTNTKITSEDIYNFYKRTRDNTNLVFYDIKPENFGVLTKDNVAHWKEPLYNDDENLNLLPYKGKEVLKKGEIVLLDADNISTTDFYIPYFPYQEKLEKRYQQEKNTVKKLNKSKKRR